MTIRVVKTQFSSLIQTLSALALSLIVANLFSARANAENQFDKQFADTPWSTAPLPDSLRIGKPTTQPVVASDGTVDASQATGGFSSLAQSHAEIDIRWGTIKGATELALFRSTTPKFKACYRNLITDHPSYGPPNMKDGWPDTSVQRGTRYYYILAAIVGDKCFITATGSCATPAHDQWDDLEKMAEEQAKPAQLSGQIGDFTTPAGAMTALINAIENDKPDIVAAHVTLPPEPSDAARQLDPEQLIWASRLEWWVDQKFGKYMDQTEIREHRYAEDLCDDADLRYVYYPTKGELQYLRDNWNSGDKTRTKLDAMQKNDNGWAFRGGRVVVNGPLAIHMENQPNRIAVLRDVFQSCQSGKLKTVQAIRAALARGFDAPQGGQTVCGAWTQQDLQLTTTIHAIQNAINRGDRAALIGLILTQNEAAKNDQADYLITNRAIVNAIYRQFRKPVALRIFRMLDLLESSWGPQRDNTWTWYQDAAFTNPVLFRNYTPWNLMALVDGKWFMDCRRLQRFRGAQRMALSKKLLASVKNSHTVLQLMMVRGAGIFGSSPEQQMALARNNLLRRIADYSQTDYSELPGGPEETNLNRTMNIWRLWSETGLADDIDTETKFLYADHDDGSYARARVRWIHAANQFNVYLSWTMPTSRVFAQETSLLTTSDDPPDLGGGDIFTVSGDSASAEVDSLWTDQSSNLDMKRINGQWKIDISRWAGPDPKSAAAKLDILTQKLRHITEQLKSDQFDDMDQLKKTLKNEGFPLTENLHRPAQ